LKYLGTIVNVKDYFVDKIKTYDTLRKRAK